MAAQVDRMTSIALALLILVCFSFVPLPGRGALFPIWTMLVGALFDDAGPLATPVIISWCGVALLITSSVIANRAIHTLMTSLALIALTVAITVFFSVFWNPGLAVWSAMPFFAAVAFTIYRLVILNRGKQLL